MEIHGKVGRFTGLISVRCLFLFHPLTILAYLGVLFTIAFLFPHPAFTATHTLLAFLLAGYFASFGAVFQKLKTYAPFTLAVALLNPFFNHRGFHILFYLFDKPITLEAFCYGLYMTSFLMSLLLVFITVNQVLTSQKLLYLFSGVAPQTSFIVSMTLRFSGLLRQKAIDFLNVQRSRDADVLHKASKMYKLKHSGNLLGAFCVWALEDGMRSAETLRAKEYGKNKRTHYKTYVFTAKDGIFTVLFLSFLVAICVLRLKGAGDYDYFRNLTAPSLDSLSRVAYLLVSAYMLLPFTIDCATSIRRCAE